MVMGMARVVVMVTVVVGYRSNLRLNTPQATVDLVVVGAVEVAVPMVSVTATAF